MSFRVAPAPRDRATDWRVAAADGQMGCLVKLYRDWQLSGDDELLRAVAGGPAGAGVLLDPRRVGRRP